MASLCTVVQLQNISHCCQQKNFFKPPYILAHIAARNLNKCGIYSQIFVEVLQYQISILSVQSMPADTRGRTDRHDEVKRRFSLFMRKAPKQCSDIEKS